MEAGGVLITGSGTPPPGRPIPYSGDATEEGRCMRTMLFYEACTVLYEELATRASIETLISHASGVATYNSYI